MALPSIGGGRQFGDGNLSEAVIGTMSAPATMTDTGTISAASIANGLIVGTPTAAATYTTTTGTLLDATFVNAKVGSSVDFYIVNVATNSSYDITVAAGTGVTLVGGLEVSSNNAVTDRSAGHFRAYRTAAATWTIYRIS